VDRPGNSDEHHQTPCPARDDGGWPWIRRDYTGRPNPMGWGRPDARVVLSAGGDAREADSLPDGAEWRLLRLYGRDLRRNQRPGGSGPRPR
jgi:hypothetical protein